MSTVCPPDASFTICKKDNDYLAAAGETKMVLLVDNEFRMMILLIKIIKNTQGALGPKKSRKSDLKSQKSPTPPPHPPLPQSFILYFEVPQSFSLFSLRSQTIEFP